MKKSKYSKELAVAKLAARGAGKLLIRSFGKESKRYAKGKYDFALKADRDAEKIIIRIIKRHFPSHAILAEESGEQGDSEYKWLIDPLDGTHNYASGVPVFGTSVALQHKSEVVVGAIYLPLSNELYYAERGRGAFLNGKKIRAARGWLINVGGTHRFNSSFVARGIINITRKYHPRLRFIGSAVIAAAYVASGRVAAYVTFHVHAWDIAAGALIVEEAGGKATSIHGKKWSPYQKHYILSNAKIHKEILRTVK